MFASSLFSLCLFVVATAAAAAPAEAPQSPGAWPRHIIDDFSKGADGVRLADVNGDGRPDIATGWEEGGAVRVCLNPGPAKAAARWPAVTVGAAPDVEDAVFADLDGDGALDVISSCEGETRAIFVHWAPREPGRLLDPAAWATQSLPPAAGLMRWMFVAPLQIDGQGGIDLIAGGKDAGAAIGWLQSPADPRRLADWRWHPLRPCGWVMSLMPIDMDGDGDRDILFSDRKGERSGAAWLENPGPGPLQARSWAEHPIGGAGREAMFLSVADLDGDGLEDVLLAVKPRDILWLRRLNASGRAWEAHVIPQPDGTGTAKAVSAADLDGDGRLDLVFSCEKARSPRQGLMWLSGEGSPAAGRWTAHPLSGADGIKHDLIATVDLNGDARSDVITTEEMKNGKGLGVIWYENPGAPGMGVVQRK